MASRKSPPSKPKDRAMSADAATLDALIRRIEKLERSANQPASIALDLDAEKYWVVDRLKRSAEKRGEVVYGGVVTVATGEQYLWQRHAGVNALFERDWAGLDSVIAALGHPVRLKLLKLILDGRGTKAELEKSAVLGTTGQLYHHLKTLQDTGWVRSLERGTYGVPGERVVPLLAILTAAAG